MPEHITHHTLQANSLVADVGAHWLWNYATDFLSAARAFSPPTRRFSPVPYYLVCRSIELSIKAYLYSCGVKKQEQKKLSHDLEKALTDAEKHNLSSHIDITAAEREALAKANHLYRKKEFEYVESLATVFDPHYFDLNTLVKLAERLISAVESPVKQAIVR